MIPAPPNRYTAAGQALKDAAALVEDVREVGAIDFWQQISEWNPTRLACAVIALSAMAQPDDNIGERLAWTKHVADLIEAS